MVSGEIGKQTESKRNQNSTCLHAEKTNVMSSCSNPIRILEKSIGFGPTSAETACSFCGISAT